MCAFIALLTRPITSTVQKESPPSLLLEEEEHVSRLTLTRSPVLPRTLKVRALAYFLYGVTILRTFENLLPVESVIGEGFARLLWVSVVPAEHHIPSLH